MEGRTPGIRWDPRRNGSGELARVPESNAVLVQCPFADPPTRLQTGPGGFSTGPRMLFSRITELQANRCSIQMKSQRFALLEGAPCNLKGANPPSKSLLPWFIEAMRSSKLNSRTLRSTPFCYHTINPTENKVGTFDIFSISKNVYPDRSSDNRQLEYLTASTHFPTGCS